MIKFFQALFNDCEPYKYGVWYNHHVHDRKAYPVVFDKEGNYIDCKVGVKLLMGKTKSGDNIYYKVTSYHRDRPWSDWLYSSDSIKCTMKFSHIERVSALTVKKEEKG